MGDLTIIKKHLQIDEDYQNDNDYLLQLYNVAEQSILRHLNVSSIEELKGEEENIPLPIQQAILLLIGNLYKNREPVSDKTAIKIPYTFEYLIDFYRKY